METQEKLFHSRIWGLLSDYADIRDELDDALCSIQSLYEELGASLEDIGDELKHIEAHILSVNGTLRRFRGSAAPYGAHAKNRNEGEGLPWN